MCIRDRYEIRDVGAVDLTPWKYRHIVSIIGLLLALGIYIPVSYTHLDVYKRQSLGCPDCIWWLTGFPNIPSRLSLIHISVVFLLSV